jgi:hypothetical protein
VGTVIILSSAAWVAMSSLKSAPPPVVDDPESRPISRTPSPSPLPGTKTLRGEHYSYASLSREAELQKNSTASSSSATLNVPPREVTPYKLED